MGCPRGCAELVEVGLALDDCDADVLDDDDGRETVLKPDCERLIDDPGTDVCVTAVEVEEAVGTSVIGEPTVVVDTEFGGGLATVDGTGIAEVKDATGEEKEPDIDVRL